LKWYYHASVLGGENTTDHQTAKDHGLDVQRTKDASEDMDRYLPGLRHSGSSGSHHLNPAAFIPPVIDEEESTDNKRKWRMRR